MANNLNEAQEIVNASIKQAAAVYTALLEDENPAIREKVAKALLFSCGLIKDAPTINVNPVPKIVKLSDNSGFEIRVDSPK